MKLCAAILPAFALAVAASSVTSQAIIPKAGEEVKEPVRKDPPGTLCASSDGHRISAVRSGAKGRNAMPSKDYKNDCPEDVPVRDRPMARDAMQKPAVTNLPGKM